MTNEVIGKELITKRIVDAPIDRVWRAFTEPKEIIQWWGPKGFSNTNKEMSVKVGGLWRFTMHGPDGVNYPNKIHYT